MLSMFVSSVALFVVLLLIFLSLNKLFDSKAERRKKSEFSGVIGVCELNNDVVFISTPAPDFEKIKKVYEAQGGKCYEREQS
jgi:hypothetical protein